MKLNNLLCVYVVIILFHITHSQSQNLQQTVAKSPDTQWLIIGAGPAGICAVGVLLDLGIDPQLITWLDPKFNVGRLGESYSNVPSNTQTKFFIEFINCCKSFQESHSPSIEKLYTYNPDLEYPLRTIVEPLRDITNYFCTKVVAIKNSLKSLDFYNDMWHVGIDNHIITTHNVILATGSHPRTLNYDCYDCMANTIPLDTALDKTLLAEQISGKDSIAVIGSSHSAILILKHLSELPVKRIINFYKKPLQYAIANPNGEIILGEAGLKGMAARWAIEVLEKGLPAHLIRVLNQPDALNAWLPICNKIIYAIGFEKNQLPPINGNNAIYDSYDGSSGVIAPRLFGIGIAFPEVISDEIGGEQLGIGLSDFMDYAQRILPTWTKRNNNYKKLSYFNALFSITSL